jgi:hypothetical protein
MKWIATIVAALLLGLSSAPAMAQSSSEPELLMQKPPKRHPRARIEVRPRAYPYRHYHSLYPVPYDVEYPGPNAHRECSSRLVVEHRASGSVIVPRVNCRWARGRYAGP